VRLPEGYVARPAAWDDLDAVVEVFNACDLVDIGVVDLVRDHIISDWRSTNYDLARDSRLVTVEGTVVAYASVGGFNPTKSMETFGRVHPEHRGRGLGTAIVTWCERHALELSPSVPVVKNSVPSTDEAAKELLGGAGYAHVRTFWHMTRDLASGVEPTPEPPGVVLRRYRRGTDLRPTYEALEEAFLDHWGSEPFPFEQHERELGEMDPRGVAVAEVDGEVVGVAMGRTIEGDGWVDVIGVRPPWRGRGIARALLLRVFDELASLGAASAALNVDAENTTGATRLYESAGMSVHRVWLLFEKRFGDR